jgi:hypothetical protein
LSGTLAITCAALLAVAQTEDEPGGARIDPSETVEIPPTETVQTSTTGAPCPPLAMQIYAGGFEDLAHGENVAAHDKMTQVLDLCPSHPYAAELKRLAASAPGFEVEPQAGGVLRGRRVDRKLEPKAEQPAQPPLKAETKVEGEQSSSLARAELVAFQTLHGVAQGLIFCAAIDCDDGRATVAASFLGVAALGGGSLALSSGIRPGQALAINSGTGWGTWNALSLAAIQQPDDGETIATMVFVLNLAGTGAGTMIAVLGKPESGQVSFANSTGIWSGVLALWAMNLAGVDLFEDGGFWEAMLAATDIGLGIGAIASTEFEISRARTLLIDAGGIVGMLLGLGTAVLIDENPDQELVGGLGFVGTASGLLSAALLSRQIDAPAPPKGVTFLPGGPRGTFGGTLAVEF